MKNITILRDEQLEMVTGGKVNTNMTPSGPNIDKIINNRNYDWIADKIVEYLEKDNPNSSYNTRTRQVNNDVDIYDFDV